MKIDGRILAAEILTNLRKDLRKILKKNHPPQLAVFWIGNDSASASFITQKQIAAKRTGAKILLYHFKKTPEYQKIAESLHFAADNPYIHGIIIQRPLPPQLPAQSLTNCIGIKKDIDGFLPKSKFDPPVAMAVYKILKEIYYTKMLEVNKPAEDFPKALLSYLKSQKIVLLGRGETAGKPIANLLNKFRLNFINLNSQSENRNEYLKIADIVISCVGKSNIFDPAQIKQQLILLGVGIHKEKGKLIGDYNEKNINFVSYYTPTPGGVGPVNVACLMQNLITAYKSQL